MKLVCVDCGKNYPLDLRTQWGKTPQTDGFGSSVSCVELVPGNGPLCSDGSQPQMICGGQLALSEGEA